VNVRSVLAVIAISALLPASPAAAKSHGAYKKGKTWTYTFATDTLGIAPPNTTIFGGTWSVVVDSAAAKGAARDSASAPPDSAPAARVLRQSESDDGVRFHYMEFKKPVLNDMTASVRFRIVAGEMGPSVGLLFQLDPKGKNGYLVRVRSDEQDLVAHYLLSAKRRDLKMAKIAPPAFGTWHTISVSRKGSSLKASYDGVQLIDIRDERFSKGSVGLWTEDDTVADFADLTVSVQ
jgi:hypothetical protein